MRRKLVLTSIIAALAIFPALFMTAAAAGEKRTDASGQWRYVLKENGAVLTGYVEEPVGDLVIPGQLDGTPVTAIGEEAFENCSRLTGVVIPDSVTSIGYSAFWECGEDLVLSVGKGSYAQRYARELRIPFVLISDGDASQGEADGDSTGAIAESEPSSHENALTQPPASAGAAEDGIFATPMNCGWPPFIWKAIRGRNASWTA